MAIMVRFVGRGIGPTIFAPVAKAVSIIFAAASSKYSVVVTFEFYSKS